MKRFLIFLGLIASAICGDLRHAKANTERWQGVSGTSVSTNWSDNANWNNLTGTGNAGYTNNDLLFDNTGAAGTDNTINSVANTSDQALSITFTNQSSQFHTVLIPTGNRLTNANGLTVGSATGVDANNTKVNFTGGGTLIQKGNVTVRNNCNTSGSTSLATLDLSGLAFFVCSNNGTLNVGGTGTETRSAGQLVLAGTSNNITVTTFNLQTTSGNGGNSGGANIRLGGGTNIINAATINVVAGKTVSGTMSFPGATGGIRIRGANGNADDSSRATISLCNRNSGGTGTMNGTADFSGGHLVDIKAGTITIGQAGSNPSSAGQNGTGIFRFDAGTVDATTINMAVNTVANAATFGNLVVGGGSLSVSNVSLVNQTAGAATGNLFIGGSMACSGNLIKTTVAGTGNVTITNGSLAIAVGKTLGASGVPIDNLTLEQSTLTLAAGGSLPSAFVNNLFINGTTDTINISAVPGLGQFPVLTYASLSGASDFVLGSLPPGYQGYISNNVSALSVDVVITNSIAKNDTWRGNVNGNWDLSTANWLSSGNPSTFAQGDAVTFDDTLTGTPNVSLTANVLPGGITFNNSSHNYVLGGNFKISGATTLTQNGSSSTTLTESGDDFAGGIVVNSGTLILDNTNSTISGGLTINAGTAQIGNNDGNGALPTGLITDNGSLVFKRTNAVTVGVSISGIGSLTQNGTGVLTLSSTNSYTGNTVVNSGTLALSGAGTISNSAQVQVTGATLNVSGIPQSLVSGLNLTNAAVTVALNGNGITPIPANALSVGGSGNTINVSSIPPIASYPVKFVIIQSASPINGTFNVSLGTTPAATPPYVGSISESVDQLSVLLTLTSGPVGTRPSVSWNGADVPNLNTNWSDRLNWQLPGAPVAGDVVLFNDTASSFNSALSIPGGGSAALIFDNVNNIVDASFNLSSLTFTNDNNSYHNTYINSGNSLNITNTGGLTVGGYDVNSIGQQENVTISGSNGRLTVSNANASINIWTGDSGSAASSANLDLSALDTFTANVSRFLVGAAINNVVNRPNGVVYLAKTNSISAGFQTSTIEAGTTTANAALVVADCNQNAGTHSYIYLGQVNTISADTIAVARQKATGDIRFNPIYVNAAPYPSVTFLGFTNNRVTIFDIGDGVGNTGSTTPVGVADFSGGVVTASVDTLNVGRSSSAGTGGNASTGTLTFDAGTIDANTINLGLQLTNKIGRGTANVASNSIIGATATLIARGSLNLGATTTTGSGTPSTIGTLNITNGTVRANVIACGTNNSPNTAINLIGGQLYATNGIGSASAPLANLTLAPLGTPDNSATLLQVPAPGAVIGTLTLDGLATTTNIVNVSSVGNLLSLPAEVPLIQYTFMNVLGGAFNVGLGTLPAGYTASLTNDTANSMIALYITAAPPKPPVITSFMLQSGNLVATGTNGYAGATYYVLGSTNVTLPRNLWTPLATNTFDSSGNFSVSIPMDPAKPQSFFSLQAVGGP